MRVQLIIANLGITAASAWALLHWLGENWRERLKAELSTKQQAELHQLRSEHERQLEELRGDLKREADSLNSVLAGIQNSYASSHPKVVEALASAWAQLVEIRDVCSNAFFPYEILAPAEYETAFSNPRLKACVNLTENELLDGTVALRKEIVKQRPLLGEPVFRLTIVYVTVCGRVAYRAIEGKAEGKLPDWRTDKKGDNDYIQDILATVIPSSDLRSLLQPTPFVAPSRLLDYVESRIAAEMNDIVLGKRYATIGIDAQQGLRRVFTDIELGRKG